jgi:glycosyltransferase involved in cell wall biosynthesis
MLLSIVIPVLNEAQTVPLLLDRLRHSLQGKNWELIFIDDGSTDATASILAREALQDDTNKLVPRWASVVALQCVFSGMILLALGAIGDYVGRNYEQAKQRPLYVVTESRNISQSQVIQPRAVIVADPISPLLPFVLHDLEPLALIAAASPSYQAIAGTRA